MLKTLIFSPSLRFFFEYFVMIFRNVRWINSLTEGPPPTPPKEGSYLTERWRKLNKPTCYRLTLQIFIRQVTPLLWRGWGRSLCVLWTLFICAICEKIKQKATLSKHSLTDDTDEQKEQISFLHTERLRDLKVGEFTDL